MKKYFLLLIIVLFCATAKMKGQTAPQLTATIDSLRSAIAMQQGKEMMDTYQRLAWDLYDTDDLQKYFDFMEEYEAALLHEIRRERDEELINVYIRRYALKKLNYAYFAYNWKEYEIAEKQTRIGLEFCLEHEEKENKLYYYMLFDVLLEILDVTLQHETLQHEILKLYEDARANNDIAGMSVAAFSLARFYKNQERWAEAEKYYRESIELFNQQS